MRTPTAADGLKRRIDAGETILIDGATGTELEFHGVPMVQGVWTGDAARTHPDAVRAVHTSHIAAGAELIIANTYASHRHLLVHAGLEGEFELLNRRGVELAIEARDAADRPDVVVAGSMSTSRQNNPRPVLAEATANFREQARIQADAGAEVILLEMMRDIDETLACAEAALATGLPVWLGWSCHSDGYDEPMLWEKGHTLRQGMAAIADLAIDVVSIMHTEVDDVDASLDVVFDTWDGPVGVYAHSGDFVHPNWIFNGVISASDYADHSRRWLDRGVQIIGGCCGIGADHIAHLHTAMGR